MADLLKDILPFLSKSETMPVLFLGHGSPMNAIEENEFVENFRKLASNLPTPSSILCISAHWYTRGTFITATERPKTIHDFYGFPKELYAVQYPAHGNPRLAKEVKQLLQPVYSEETDEWGLDHGTWSLLKNMYPEANIPVIQMSIDGTKPASYHYELAKQLSSLRNKGVLIIGSGNIVHNLRMVDFQNMNRDDYGFDWAREARSLFNQYILDKNHQPMLDYKNLQSAIQMAVPTPDHYLPLLYTLSLQEKKENTYLFNDKMVGGSLSMTSVVIA
ncbi:MAG: 4,5-DOPA dioxygenase extradiol [Bacteroidales bacterium]|nr:4,5-DOPA dioxygenase extradiol [Bacteroidales bacterium]